MDEIERLKRDQKKYERMDRKFEWTGFKAFIKRHGVPVSATLGISLLWNILNSPFALFILQNLLNQNQ